jgi:hypothetical protein
LVSTPPDGKKWWRERNVPHSAKRALSSLAGDFAMCYAEEDDRFYDTAEIWNSDRRVNHDKKMPLKFF